MWRQSIRNLLFNYKLQIIMSEQIWEKALVSLTPGGSEFCGASDYCVKYVKEFQASQHKFICELIKEKKELKEALQESPIVSKFSNAEYFISAYETWRDKFKTPALTAVSV
jgi:hypothetical protein